MLRTWVTDLAGGFVMICHDLREVRADRRLRDEEPEAATFKRPALDPDGEGGQWPSEQFLPAWCWLNGWVYHGSGPLRSTRGRVLLRAVKICRNNVATRVGHALRGHTPPRRTTHDQQPTTHNSSSSRSSSSNSRECRQFR